MSDFANVDEAIAYLKENMAANSWPATSPDAARYLGKSGDERALQPLLQALQEGGDYFRATAAAALGYLGKVEAVPALTKAIVSDRGVYVRCDAALALGALGAEESLPLLLDRFQLENFEVRKRIVMAVSQFRGAMRDRALDAVESMIRDMPATDEGQIDFLLYLVEQGRLRDR